jgi:hypothetical protein
MHSVALQEWLTVRVPRLDEIEDAHRSIGGSGPGRRYATQQINQAYAMLLSAQFQGFCRDLHTECARFLANQLVPASCNSVIFESLTLNRKLDRGNPNPGNIGSDFSRLGLSFWREVESLDAHTTRRKSLLDELAEWRNAIAHQDFDVTKLGGTIVLRLDRVRNWRSACHGLAQTFDQALASYLHRLIGLSPW